MYEVLLLLLLLLLHGGDVAVCGVLHGEVGRTRAVCDGGRLQRALSCAHADVIAAVGLGRGAGERVMASGLSQEDCGCDGCRAHCAADEQRLQRHLPRPQPLRCGMRCSASSARAHSRRKALIT